MSFLCSDACIHSTLSVDRFKSLKQPTIMDFHTFTLQALAGKNSRSLNDKLSVSFLSKKTFFKVMQTLPNTFEK